MSLTFRVDPNVVLRNMRAALQSPTLRKVMRTRSVVWVYWDDPSSPVVMTVDDYQALLTAEPHLRSVRADNPKRFGEV